MIFETHAHYDDPKFKADQLDLLGRMQEAGIGRIVNVGSTIATSDTSVELAHRWEFIYAAVGVHPEEIADFEDRGAMDHLRELSTDPRVVAIGEIGLDYYWVKDPGERAKQRKWFGAQLDLAAQVGLPVIIHSRDAAEDTMQIMREAHERGIGGVIHCYSYSKEQALEYVKMGYFIGVGGVVTFKNGRKLRQTVEAIPMDRIVLETDSPYMAPEPHRGTRNDSRNLRYVAAEIARIRQIPYDEVVRITEENAYRLYPRAKQ